MVFRRTNIQLRTCSFIVSTIMTIYYFNSMLLYRLNSITLNCTWSFANESQSTAVVHNMAIRSHCRWRRSLLGSCPPTFWSEWTSHMPYCLPYHFLLLQNKNKSADAFATKFASNLSFALHNSVSNTWSLDTCTTWKCTLDPAGGAYSAPQTYGWI